MANADKLLRALLPKVYKMADGEIDSLLSESTTDADGESLLFDKDKARIAEISKPKTGQTFQDGYKKAKGEVLSQFEKELKEKYGIDDTDANNPLTGIELVAAVIEKEAPEAGKATLTEDAIKKHPVYIRLEKEVNKRVADKEKEWKDKLETAEKGFKKAETFGTVKNKALSILGELNPVLSANAQVAQNQQNAWLSQFSNMEFEAQDDGSLIILKDGKRLEDGHGNPVDFESFVKDSATGYFDFKQNNGGANPGKSGKDEGKGGKKPYPTGVTKPKKFDELAAIMNDSNVKAEDKAIVMETWEAENPNS